MSITCLAAWVAAFVLLPIVVLLWATESRQQRARRWRQAGLTQQAIADRLGCSRCGGCWWGDQAPGTTTASKTEQSLANRGPSISGSGNPMLQPSFQNLH